MKKAAAFALAIITALSLCGCGKGETPETDRATTAEEAGVIQSPEEVLKNEAETLTPQSALEKGYFVIDGDEVRGEEEWQRFLVSCGEGKSAEAEAAQFIEGKPYLELLCFDGEKYALHEYSDEAGYEKSEYTYLRPLLGKENGKSVVYFVLTDSLVLTYDDARWSVLSSDTETVTKIPFKWIGFSVYAKNSTESAKGLIEKDLRTIAEKIANGGDPTRSSVYSYISASPEEYKSLCAGGDDAVGYIKSIIEKSPDDGLVENILAAAAAEILGEDDKDWSSGKEWMKEP